MYSRRYRSGFSLIELLIVVAIIAALIGVAVPYFQSNLSEAQVTKAKQDLDTIRNAINLFESKYRPIVGKELKQILGQTMQDIPKDPWGADYYLDANLGIIWSYGADGQPGGQAGDADQLFQYKPKLQLRKAEYEGPFGVPAKANRFTLTFTKPFTATPAAAAGVIELVRDTTSVAAAAGTREPFSNGGKFPQGWTADAVRSDPKNGILVLSPTNDPTGNRSTMQSITPTMAIDVSASAFTVIRVAPYANPTVPDDKSVILNFEPSAPAAAATSSVLKYYGGYPAEFAETGAVRAENQIGARIERKQ